MTTSRNSRRFGVMRYSSIELLATLVLFFLVTPFVEDMEHGEYIEAGLLTLVLVSACLAVGGQRKVLVIAALLLLPMILA